jgi:hypothetical protein
MSRSMANSTIEAVIDELKAGLGDALLSIYLYGSLSDGTYQADQSDVNVVALIKNPAAIHQVRGVLRTSVWPKYGHTLRQTPVVATPQAFARHLHLNPLLNDHFSRSGQLLLGEPTTFDPEVDLGKCARLANQAAQAMRASAALAPSLLPVKEAQESLASLRSLARRLFGWPVDADESPAVLAGRVLGIIRKKMDEDTLALWPDEVTPNAPPLVSELRAIYEMDSHLILVMPDLEPVELARRIASADWAQVADRITDQYRGLRVTTPSQLLLIIRYEDCAEYLLQSYQHAWGADPIADVDVSSSDAFRGLARLPSELELAVLPHAYFMAEDSDLSMLIHDFQNKLLNIQLRNELLCRRFNMPITLPPKPLPERVSPETVRLDAIFAHLHWWADHYLDLMLAATGQAGELDEVVGDG